MTVSLHQRVTPEQLAFWRFSGQVYAHPQVAEALLEAQTRWQIWINDWLFALWQARQQRVLRATFNQQLVQQHRWRHAVIMPWRTRRKLAKTTAPHTYSGLLSAELALEWCDQLTLSYQAQRLTHPAVTQAAGDRLRHSLGVLSASTPEAMTRLEPILTRALWADVDCETTATRHKP